uniref:Uncharacterized protein n=1 Tax=Stomoxys calcitrans TaxID=35570 RepID=A0A1I8PDN3_STOCA|nr:unnamed protein product [Stomoxys calcitrans]
MLHSSMQEHQQQQHEQTRQTSAISTISNKRAQQPLQQSQQSGEAAYRNAELRPLTVSQLDTANNGVGRPSQRLNRQDSDTSSFAGRRTRLKDGGVGGGGGGGGGGGNSHTMHSNETPTGVLVNSAAESRHRRGDSTRSQLRKPSSSSVRPTSNAGQYSGMAANNARTPNDPTTQSHAAKSATSQLNNPAMHQQRHQPTHQSSATAATVSSSSTTNNSHHHRNANKKPASDRSDDERLSNTSGEPRRMRRRRSRRRNKHDGMSGGGGMSSSSSSSSSSSGSSTGSSCNGSCSSDDGDSSTSSGEPNLPYPGFPEVALKYLTQDTRPRNWCLMLITNPYPFLSKY